MNGPKATSALSPFYSRFCCSLDEAVPDDHLVRKIDAALDLSWVYAELAQLSLLKTAKAKEILEFLRHSEF